MIRWVCACALFLVAVALVGCEKKQTGSTRARVTGKVTLDGKALTTGMVTFDANNGEPPGSFSILDGKYEGLAHVGKNKVRLTAFQKISMKEKMKMDGPGYDTLVEENRLPPRYNHSSQVFREVEAGDENIFNFPLQSK